MRLRAAVDKAGSNREQYVDKFCNNLDRDITELGKEVKEIKNQAQVCSIIIDAVYTLKLSNKSDLDMHVVDLEILIAKKTESFCMYLYCIPMLISRESSAA